MADLPPHARTAAGEKELRAEPVRSAAPPRRAGGRAVDGKIEGGGEGGEMGFLIYHSSSDTCRAPSGDAE